ncbi:DsbA family protein [Vibrio aquaticus]|uniref:DsbA family protein n=1 Tax=Vibrio aquaticus TaxID=2496559 RepID=A0A3S0PRL8_9VIBR|nr:DsbA family protein [Vibrio aquaticus]RTZ18367.1 DsbA family protein [Vibrio aquaticus]
MLKKLTVALVMGAVLSAPAFAITQEEKISQIVSMLEENPQVVDGLHESLGLYIKQQQQFTQLLESSKRYLNDGNHTYMGAENGELTLINVTDYSCPFCKKLDGELEKLVANYPQIKVVNVYVPLKEGSDSVNSAAFALNVWKNDREKYQEVHDLLVAKPGTHNMSSLMKIAKKTGTSAYLNTNDSVRSQLENNYGLFTGLGLRGTPALIIGEQVIPGYVPYEQLEQVIEEAL